MTEILTTGAGRHRAGVRRIKKLNGKVDMTPMVDLGFLLIKPNKEASYQTIIKALDEATINVVKKYAVLSATAEETEWMKKQKE
jgi:hypothetical protein